jgi:hypothetical protein
MRIRERLKDVEVTAAFVAFDPATGASWGLNPTAHYMLLKLKEGLDAGAIAAGLRADFDGTEDVDTERVIREFVAGLVGRGILQPGDDF